MSLLKSEIKYAVTTEVGNRVDDALEAAKRDLSVLEGRKAAFHDGARAVEALMAIVDKDVEEGKFDLVTAEIVKRYVGRCMNALQNMAMQGQNFLLAQAGKIQGMEHSVALLKSIVDDEKRKMDALRAAITAGTVGEDGEALAGTSSRERPQGSHPAMSLKEQRLAEEESEKAAAEQAAQEAAKVAEQAAAQVAAQAAAQAEAAQAAQLTHWKQRGKKSRASNT